MAPSQALGFPRPSTEAPNVLQLTAASSWERWGPRVCCEWSSARGQALPDIASGHKTPLPALAQGQEHGRDWGSAVASLAHTAFLLGRRRSHPEKRGGGKAGVKWVEAPWVVMAVLMPIVGKLTQPMGYSPGGWGVCPNHAR